MSISSVQNGNHPVNSGSILFSEGQPCISLNILTEGIVDIYLCFEDSIPDEENILSNSIKIASLSKNNFIGITSLILENQYLFTFVAKDKSSVYIYKLQNSKLIEMFFDTNKSYMIFVLQTLCSIISSLDKTIESLTEAITNLKIINDNLAVIFWNFKSLYPVNKEPRNEIFSAAKGYLENMPQPIPESFTNQYAEKDHSSWFNISYNPSVQLEKEDFVSFFKEFSQQSPEMRKAFLTSNIKMGLSLASIASSLINEMTNVTKRLMREFVANFQPLYGNEICSIFSEYASAAIALRKESKPNTHYLLATQFIVEKLYEIDKKFQDNFGYKFDIDFKYINTILNEVKGVRDAVAEKQNEKEDETIEVIAGFENIPSELKNSAKKIIEYSDIAKERADLFIHSLNEFRKAKDKFDTEDGMRKIRKGLTSVFFEIYKKVALKVINNNNNERLYDMFLNYSYMDEQLLDINQTILLYKLKDTTKQDDKIKVYNLKEWLTLIYNEEVNPSVNGFGQTYKEALREMLKRGMINKDEMTANLESPEKKLKYEVENMLSNAQKICYGQISIYAPVLHKDMIVKDMSQSFVTKNLLTAAVHELLSIDFSAFYREILYKNPEKGIDKELIMAEIVPIFITTPTFGSRSVMWQDIDGLNKSSPGRILFPIFTSMDINDLVITAVGAFRWELCKNILGVSWNDVTKNSLTSNYNDYVQFYKKNRNLSEETKAKVKIQIQKSRGNLKEFFIDDYELWIKYESKGIARLNKVVRNILYRFCPFRKNIRDVLHNQPLFNELTNKFANIRKRDLTNVENRFHKLTKTGAPLPDEIANHIAFYRDY